jgi:alpha-tubulin suppressor-like RCC1 family protein
MYFYASLHKKKSLKKDVATQKLKINKITCKNNSEFIINVWGHLFSFGRYNIAECGGDNE